MSKEPNQADGQPRQSLGAWAMRGSLISAILASACCWLPLLAVAFGASAAGASAFFEQYRPYFLAIAATLLAVGFYFLYLRKKDCEPDSACAAPNPKAQRFSRGMFWVSVLFIGAFAFFPHYVGALLGGTGTAHHAVSEGQTQVTLSIEGMSCEACAATIHSELTKVPGVTAAEVLYEQKQATVQIRKGALTTDEDLLAAVERAGYHASLLQLPTGRDR